MEKVIKSKIFLVIITAIIFTSLGVYAATTYKASDVIYSASDGSSMNVEDALNNIYEIKTLGTATANNILSEKTAVVQGKLILGTMSNYGNLNWNPTTSATYTIKPGYYSGGTISTVNSYNAGYNNGRNEIRKVSPPWYIINEMVSTGATTNIRTASYTIPSDGLLSYLCYASNDKGSKVYMQLNGVTLKERSDANILSISDIINVKKGDQIFLYAYGVKGTTSNSSALVDAVFSPYN